MNQIFERVRQRVLVSAFAAGHGAAQRAAGSLSEDAERGAVRHGELLAGRGRAGGAAFCVIVDRLPFAVPSDPVVAARVKALQEDGRNAFAEYQVPEAVLALKQGFGRLIRTRTDRGILAILDNRIQRMQYGRIFLESLPEYSITRDIAEVRRFMQTSGDETFPSPRTERKRGGTDRRRDEHV